MANKLGAPLLILFPPLFTREVGGDEVFNDVVVMWTYDAPDFVSAKVVVVEAHSVVVFGVEGEKGVCAAEVEEGGVDADDFGFGVEHDVAWEVGEVGVADSNVGAGVGVGVVVGGVDRDAAFVAVGDVGPGSAAEEHGGFGEGGEGFSGGVAGGDAELAVFVGGYVSEEFGAGDLPFVG